jgi:hypothetical protein
LATKSDLTYERQVSTKEGIELAQKYGITFMEVSAKSGQNVKEGFELLVMEIHKQFESKCETSPPACKKEITLSKSGQK